MIVRRFLLLFCILFFSCVANAQSWKIEEITSPASAPSGEPNLAAAKSTTTMIWLETLAAGGHALKFATRNGAQWTPSATIVSGRPFFVNWADFPSVLQLSDGTLVAQWLEKRGKSSYAYHVFLSLSKDGGKTWGTSFSPHSDQSEGEHGFVTLVDRGKGTFSVVWLDGRNVKGGENHGGSGAMTLMHVLYAGGKLQQEQVLDTRVCDCCQTDAAVTKDGLVVAYRDRSDKEVRDISIVRLIGGKWTTPVSVYADNWEIAGCPVNGPAVAAEGNQVAVLWFSGAGEKPKVQAAFSSDGGATFGKPARVDQGNPSGRVDVVWTANGSVLVTWLENTKDKGAAILGQEIRPDGKAGSVFTIADTSSARASGFPRIARSGNDILIAWTYAADPPKVRVAKLVRQ